MSDYNYRTYRVPPEPEAACVGIAGSVISPPDREVSLKEQAEEVAKSAEGLYNVLDELVNGPRPTKPPGGDVQGIYTTIQQVRGSLGNAAESLARTRELVQKLVGQIGG